MEENKTNSFAFYRDYYDLITLLSEKEQQELLLAIIKYMFDDTEPILGDKSKKIFNNLKRPLDKSKNKSKNATKENQNKIKTKSNENQNENKTKTHQDVYVNVNVKKDRINKFIKPTIEEIKSYCKERNNNVDANRFIDYYEANGWKVGKNSMKDWKACIRTWEKNNFDSNNKNIAPVPSWFDKDFKKEESTITEEELNYYAKQLEEML